MSFTLQPLTPTLGVEIEGFDARHPSADDFDALGRIWQRYKVVFLRDQALDLEQLLGFSRRFGELMRLPYIRPLEGYPQIIRVLKEAHEVDMGTFGGDWHSDFSFLEAPPKASLLLAEEVPAVGGDTLWVDMEQALARLPPDLRDALQNRSAIHTGRPYGVRHAPARETRFNGSIVIERDNPEADRETRHPAICRHPDSGAAALFVNPTYTTRIDGYPAEQSRALLDRVYRHVLRPEFACRFRWRRGSLALWDNRNTLHYAVNDYDGHRRCLYRTTIAGSPPVPA